MGYPTRGEVKDQFLYLLDDPPPNPPIAGQIPEGQVYTDAVFQRAFQEAFDALFNAMLTDQVPRIELMVNYTLATGVKQVTPAELGIEDFGDFIFLRERTWGSNEHYVDMQPVDVLSQRSPGPRLIEFNWRNNTFYFIGSTNTIDLEVKYDWSGTAPTDDDTQIGIDACKNFLATMAAGIASRSKGDWESLGQGAYLRAVGNRYEQGEIGGYLRQLIVPLVRSRQKVPVAPKPYSVFRRNANRRAIPWVAAQQGTTGGGSQNMPVQYSTATGTIVGIIDGFNAVFTIIVGVKSVEFVARNGVTLTKGVDYTLLGNQITFLPGAIPQVSDPADIITAEAFPNVAM